MMGESTKFKFQQFLTVTLLTSIWVHISEVFRYFVFVIPRTQEFFNDQIGVAQMDLGIFTIWGLWDTLLTGLVVFLFWIYSQVFGNSVKSVLMSATISWAFFFVLFWVGAANMGISDWKILWITLPLSWLEMFLASLLASKLYSKLISRKI